MPQAHLFIALVLACPVIHRHNHNMNTLPGVEDMAKPGFLLTNIVFAALLAAPIFILTFFAGRAAMQDLTTLFLSILLEALPYVLAGTLISSFIQVFVSPDTIRRFLPQRLLPALILASLFGLVLPVCECGIIPVIKRLIEKGVPLPVGITLMLAVPIINPVVLASTAAAFHSQDWALMRALFAFVIALCTGLLLSRFTAGEQLKSRRTAGNCGHCCGHGHHHIHSRRSVHVEVMTHAAVDFLDLARYLVAGAFLAALIQIAVPGEALLAVGKGPVSSSLVMMGLAYGLSLCSEADAFIASTFLNNFSQGSVFAFIILGPMLDLKNTFMLFSTFRIGFVFILSAIIILNVFVMALSINLLT